MEPPLTGKIVEWDRAKSYGFLRSGTKRYFIHIRDISTRYKSPEPGDVVTFTIGTDERGRPCAKNVVQVTTRTTVGLRAWLLLLALLILPAVVWCCLPEGCYWIGVLVIAINLGTYFAYAHDKKRARTHGWRIPEVQLHLFELMGGWAGAFVAQRRLRHKCSKGSYQAAFWFIVLLHQGLAFDSLLGWHYTHSIISHFLHT